MICVGDNYLESLEKILMEILKEFLEESLKEIFFFFESQLELLIESLEDKQVDP